MIQPGFLGSCCFQAPDRTACCRSGLDVATASSTFWFCPELCDEISGVGGPSGATFCRRPVFRCTPSEHTGPLVLLKHFLNVRVATGFVALVEADRRRPVGLATALASSAASSIRQQPDFRKYAFRGTCAAARITLSQQRKAPPVLSGAFQIASHWPPERIVFHPLVASPLSWAGALP